MNTNWDYFFDFFKKLELSKNIEIFFSYLEIYRGAKKNEIFSLQQPFKTYYTIFFFSPFYWTLNIKIKRQNNWISWIFVVWS